ncbi:MAG: hypothetical protein HY377_01265 [Candidatus Blackburnbacteria bacterium]|nr:hypothetical protein [Candidatus Blackburnbacteria bacterium]
MASVLSPQSQDTGWRSVFVMCLLAGLFTAGFRATDNIIVHNQIIAVDKMTAVSAYLIVGGWTGVVCSIVFSLLFGKKVLDPKFAGFMLRNKGMQVYALVTGGISAFVTLGLLRGSQEADPSVIIAFSSLAVLMTVFYDVSKNQLALRKFWLSGVVSMLGCILATFGGSLSATIVVVVSVLLVSNPLKAVSTVLEQRGARASKDGVNFLVWRLFWLATTGTIAAISIALARGYWSVLLDTMGGAISSGSTMIWIALTMLCVYLGIGFDVVAKKKEGVAVSYVLILVTSTQVLLGIPITFIGVRIQPEIFGVVPTEPSVWIVRLAGIALVSWGIFRLRKISPTLA